MKPMIDSWEVPRIDHISSGESRRISFLPVPGLIGHLSQDLGRGALVVEISGSLYGDEARDDFLKTLREKFLAGEPVDFVADIVTATELEQVLILSLDTIEGNDAAEGTRYRIVLREYVEPPEPPAPIDDLGLDLGLELDDLASLGLDGLKLPDILGDLPTLGDPVAPMQPALEGVKAATDQIPSLLDGLKAKFA